MKRNYSLFFITSIFIIGFMLFNERSYDPLPTEIKNLEDEQITYNEKLITAQILAEQLDHVYTVFERNMALKNDKSLKEVASIEFLNTLTDMLSDLEITVQHIKPGRKEERDLYTYIPYDLEIKCTYEKFGKFVTELEKSERLISIDSFLLNNGLERLTLSKNPEELMNQVVEMQISTVALNKKRG